MQITIVQAEIEEAIINHITQQFTVKPGRTIEVDLRATRGAEGYQAIITIRPEGSIKGDPIGPEPTPPPTPVETKPEPVPVEETAAKPLGIVEKANAARSKTPKAKVEKESPEADPPVETVAVAEEASGASEEIPVVVEDLPVAEAEAQPAPPTETAEAAPKPKSIFAGLQKPVNA